MCNAVVMTIMRKSVGLVFVLLCMASAVSVAQHAAPAADDPTVLKATIIKLQQAVLERDREIASLRGVVAELQMAALKAAIDTMDPAVKKVLMGRDDQKPVPPQTPPK